MAVLTFTVHDDFTAELAHKLAAASTSAEYALANEVADDTNDFVPASSAPAGLYDKTQVDGGYIIYPGPYARYLYHGKVMVYKDPPYLRAKGNGKVVLSHFGQKKVAIDKPLKFRKDHHKDATDHWFEASKAKNLKKWVESAGKLVKHGF